MCYTKVGSDGVPRQVEYVAMIKYFAKATIPHPTGDGSQPLEARIEVVDLHQATSIAAVTDVLPPASLNMRPLFPPPAQPPTADTLVDVVKTHPLGKVLRVSNVSAPK